jgi:hypothetical protein
MGPQTSPIEDKTRIAGVLSANRKLSKRQPLHVGLPSLGSDRNFLRRIGTNSDQEMFM